MGFPEYRLWFSVDDDGWICTSSVHPHCSWIEDDPVDALLGMRRLERDIQAGVYTQNH